MKKNKLFHKVEDDQQSFPATTTKVDSDDSKNRKKQGKTGAFQSFGLFSSDKINESFLFPHNFLFLSCSFLKKNNLLFGKKVWK